MKVKKERSYSRYTKEAAALLGQHIQLARKQRRLTEADLADRAGISRRTLQKLEKGDLTIAIGFAFEVAALTGVKLFDADSSKLTQDRDRIQDKIALLPKRVRKPQNEDVDDDF